MFLFNNVEKLVDGKIGALLTLGEAQSEMAAICKDVVERVLVDTVAPALNAALEALNPTWNARRRASSKAR